MSADLLRRAASRIAEVAEKAAAQTHLETRTEGVWLNSRFYPTADPDFMLAVAAWLEEAADHLDVETNQYDDGSVCLAVDAAAADCSIFQAALAVATAYLNEEQ